ncbi:MAG: hypothetical protein GY928_36665 [Colwellia sp.]|nr:hypothetical protein [Colwellia sp.]
MKPFKATKKPVTIEALLWDKTGRCQREMAKFIPSKNRYLDHSNCGTGDCPELYIVTLEGNMHVSEGDYVIKGVKGEFYPCKPEIFKATYDF